MLKGGPVGRASFVLKGAVFGSAPLSLKRGPFDRETAHPLRYITCTGTFRPQRGTYL